MKSYVVEFNNDPIIKDYNQVFPLNGKNYMITLPGSISIYIIKLPDELVALIKMGQYKKYIHKITRCKIQ